MGAGAPARRLAVVGPPRWPTAFTLLILDPLLYRAAVPKAHAAAVAPTPPPPPYCTHTERRPPVITRARRFGWPWTRATSTRRLTIPAARGTCSDVPATQTRASRPSCNQQRKSTRPRGSRRAASPRPGPSAHPVACQGAKEKVNRGSEAGEAGAPTPQTARSRRTKRFPTATVSSHAAWQTLFMDGGACEYAGHAIRTPSHVVRPCQRSCGARRTGASGPPAAGGGGGPTKLESSHREHDFAAREQKVGRHLRKHGHAVVDAASVDTIVGREPVHRGGAGCQAMTAATRRVRPRCAHATRALVLAVLARVTCGVVRDMP